MKANGAVELVVLVGPMGAGKSTLGKVLASDLGFEFVDSDKEIEARCGADIPWIFDVEGEEGFRNREVGVIKELSTRKKTVLATGGGAMTRSENRDYVTRTGFVVYLNTSIDQQFHRTHKDKNRPLLNQPGEDTREVLENLLAERDPQYREVADLVIDTDGKPVKTIITTILEALRSPD